MKKFLTMVAVGLTLTACAGGAVNTTQEESMKMEAGKEKEASDKMQSKEKGGDKLKLTVTTSFLEDMAEVLAGDYADISLIIPAGEDPHTYEAKPEDYNKLNEAELIFYHGLHFEGKMTEILEASENSVELTEDFDKSKLLSMEEDGETIIDPHFWFDIELYKEATLKAAKSLEEKIPEHKADIAKNLDSYLMELDELKTYGETEIGAIPKESRILITPHDAFGYFSRMYDIEVAAPQGVSTDAEVSTKEMAETADFIVKHKIKAIFAESTTDPARMEKLKESCAAKGFEVKVVSGEGNELFSDSLAPKGEKGDSYIDMVKHDIELIVSNLK